MSDEELEDPVDRVGAKAQGPDSSHIAFRAYNSVSPNVQVKKPKRARIESDADNVHQTQANKSKLPGSQLQSAAPGKKIKRKKIVKLKKEQNVTPEFMGTMNIFILIQS